MPDLRVSFARPCDESWEGMTPEGRARICARCDRAVHDLASYTLDEAEALFRREPDPCVRARIEGDGSVALKPSRRRETRRMVIAAATAGLLAAGAPAYAKKDRPPGAIAGKVENHWYRTKVVAKDASGQIFRSKVRKDGHFRIRHLPSGTYSLTVRTDCGDAFTLENVVVGNEETILPVIRPESTCIYIGMLRIENVSG